MLLLVGCGSPAATTPDGDPGVDATPADDAPDVVRTRWGTSVIVGSTHVAWSLAAKACPLESGSDCPEAAPTVMTAAAPSDTPTAWASTRRGATLVGDADELFYLNTDDYENMFIARVRPTAGNNPTPMSAPHADVSGPAVDATHVYWSEGGLNGSPFQIKRALRTGDGSDVETIATSPLRPAGFFIFDGYVIVGSSRVPVTGGTLQSFSSATTLGVFAIGPDRMYVTQAVSNTHVRLSSMTVDGTMETLVDDLLGAKGPYGPGIYDGGELFWMGGGNTYRMPATGGTPVEADSSIRWPIGVTDDAILHDFTNTGYKRIAR